MRVCQEDLSGIIQQTGIYFIKKWEADHKILPNELMCGLTDNAITVLGERYLLEQRDSKIRESPDEMFRRVARAVASAERHWGDSNRSMKWEDSFYEIMKDLVFLPNSPTLMNAGTDSGQLSACFVLPVEDSLEQIFETLKQAALIQQKGGGTGFNFSGLRPKGAVLKKTGGSAAGPVSFLRIFDAASEEIKQGGKRRGANMGILNVDHPDIESFISVKKDGKSLTNFNISVGISNAFMEAVMDNKSWRLIHPKSGMIYKSIMARELWDEIVRNAWLCGDPGLIFLDTINASNPVHQMQKIEATNPCGEVPLLPYESCNLGSINLSKFVKQEKNRLMVDWTALAETVSIAIRFLDDVVEINKYPNETIKKATLGNRKIGLGVMGWAEMLIKLKIPYDRRSAVVLGGELMKFIRDKSRVASAALAVERGCFENWQKSIFYDEEPLRNATLNSIAPTGTISILADTSSSIEPIFALAYQRKYVLNNDTLTSVNRLFLDYLYENQFKVNEILEQVFLNGSCSEIKTLPPQMRNVFKTALEIDPEWHLKHQLAFQKFTDNAVSKTINLPESATREEIRDIYWKAWQLGAKGITVFRNDSGRSQVLNKGVAGGNRGCKVCC